MKYVVICLAFYAQAAFGMVYSWTDSVGIMHCTNKEDEIPARYRAKVKARFPEAADKSAPQQNIQVPPPQPEIQPPAQLSNSEAQPPQQPVVIPEPQQNVNKQGTRRERRSRRAFSGEE